MEEQDDFKEVPQSMREERKQKRMTWQVRYANYFDDILERIMDGKSQRDLVREFGGNVATMNQFLANSDNQERVAEARRIQGQFFVEKAHECYTREHGGDKVEFWRNKAEGDYWMARAKMADPSRFGDRTQIDHTGAAPVKIVVDSKAASLGDS